MILSGWGIPEHLWQAVRNVQVSPNPKESYHSKWQVLWTGFITVHLLPLRHTSDSVLTAVTSQGALERHHSSDLFGRQIICHRDRPSEKSCWSYGGSGRREMNWKQWTRQHRAAASAGPYVRATYMRRHFRVDEADNWADTMTSRRVLQLQQALRHSTVHKPRPILHQARQQHQQPQRSSDPFTGGWWKTCLFWFVVFRMWNVGVIRHLVHRRRTIVSVRCFVDAHGNYAK